MPRFCGRAGGAPPRVQLQTQVFVAEETLPAAPPEAAGCSSALRGLWVLWAHFPIRDVHWIGTYLF